jgi:hypothetical protein
MHAITLQKKRYVDKYRGEPSDKIIAVIGEAIFVKYTKWVLLNMKSGLDILLSMFCMRNVQQD